VLYTASTSALRKGKTKMKTYYLLKGHGNDVVVPDQKDLDRYKAKVLTWKGVKVNYLTKLMRPEAEEWMKRVSEEATTGDVVLVDEENNAEQAFRKILAEMIISMFSGSLKLHYAGELTI
jgi:hypothetical protein